MTAANHRIAPDGAEWHNSVLDAPDEAVLCWAFNHRWIPGPLVRRSGYGGDVNDCRAECPCGRIRVDTLHPKTFAKLTRSYSGGHRLRAGMATKDEARAEWFRRMRAKASAAGRRSRKRAGERRPPSGGTDSTTTGGDASVAALVFSAPE